MRQLIIWVVFADLLFLEFAVLLAWSLRLNLDVWFANDVTSSESLFTRAGPWIVLTWLIVLAARGSYSVRLFGSGAEEFHTVALSSAITAGMVGMFCYLAQVSLSRGFLLLTFTFGIPLLMLERFAVRKMIHRLRVHGRLMHRVVAVGGSTGIAELVDVLEREKYVGYRVIGACLPTGQMMAARLHVPVLGNTGDIREICRQMGVDTVMVARGGYDSANELRRIAWRLEGSDVDLVVVPSLTDVAGPRISMRPVAGLPLIHVEQPQAGEAGGWAKRVFDVTVAVVLLLLFLPLLVLVAVVVKAYDRGPVFFRQARVGRTGESFHMLKFRSMIFDAEEKREALRHLNDSDGVLFKIRKDPRITPIGGFLRRYSIDELPQLWNVIRGDMSLVGPRPPLQEEVDAYGVDVHRRLLVRPGVTGLWQVSGRSELSWEESVRLDLYYVDNWSLTSDLVIMAKTLRAVVSKSGAY
ncbi:MAG: sugar transferase [Nocardioides sp.]